MLSHFLTNTCSCMLTWTLAGQPPHNHICDPQPTACPRGADFLLPVISRSTNEWPCSPELVPISYAHWIISAQQPFMSQVWHINYCWWQRERIHIIQLHVVVNVSRCQGVCFPLCWSRCPTVAICHVCPLLLCVCVFVRERICICFILTWLSLCDNSHTSVSIICTLVHFCNTFYCFVTAHRFTNTHTHTHIRNIKGMVDSRGLCLFREGENVWAYVRPDSVWHSIQMPLRHRLIYTCSKRNDCT